MSESEIRAELLRVLTDAKVDDAASVTGRIMDMIADYASERASEAAYWAERDYEERM